jgi:hypothetical protein
VRKVFYQIDSRLVRVTQATIDFMAYSNQYRGYGPQVSQGIILHIIFDKPDSVNLANNASSSSMVDISENFNVTW